MIRFRVALSVCVLAIVVSGCRRAPAPSGPLAPQVSGTLTVPGLREPVRVVRDRWGIPHIYARNQSDLFFAQGFVQAQDRIFQMDLWRRSVQGRLSAVLGLNFVERDAMTRRVQYRGSLDAEWASYGPETKAIATAFVGGVNAWVAIARARPPEEFRIAGWLPEFWHPEDLLNRTDAFRLTGNALSEVFRARVVAAVGANRAALLLPLDPPSPESVPAGLQPEAVSFRLGEVLRSAGAPPFFMSLAVHGSEAPPRTSWFAEPGTETTRGWGSNNWVVASSRSATGSPLVANDPHQAFTNPSLDYLVHLNAPGWNVIGATSPWLPGVAIGHNDHVAWGVTSFSADVQDIYVEKLNPADPHQVEERGRFVPVEALTEISGVKALSRRMTFEREYTRHGPIIGRDTERHLAFALRWTGAEPGTAAYLGAPAMDRSRSAAEFRAALVGWKTPGANFVFADTSGEVGYQAAALVPIRPTWNGTLPVPGWVDRNEWSGFYSLEDLPHASEPAAGYFATANNNTMPPGERRSISYEWDRPSRINRIRELLAGPSNLDVDACTRLQQDIVAWSAEQLVPLLEPVRGRDPEMERARQRLLGWDRRISADSSIATLYVLWERALLRKLVEGKLDPVMAREYVDGAGGAPNVLVPAMTHPSTSWFGRAPAIARDALLLDALAAALEDARGLLSSRVAGTQGNPSAGPATPNDSLPAWGSLHRVLFQHPLAITVAMRQRFDVGPWPASGYADTVLATAGAELSAQIGPSFREVLDVANWDHSVVTNAPGQSGSPASPHFADLAKPWASGAYFPLSFSDAAVQANAESTLTLLPVPARASRP
jgi:penicillin G amidase